MTEVVHYPFEKYGQPSAVLIVAGQGKQFVWLHVPPGEVRRVLEDDEWTSPDDWHLDVDALEPGVYQGVVQAESRDYYFKHSPSVLMSEVELKLIGQWSKVETPQEVKS